jgi:hypothetical protein
LQHRAQILGERGAGDNSVASGCFRILPKLSLHVRDEAQHRNGGCFRIALQVADEGEGIERVAVQVEDDERRVELCSFDGVIGVFDEFRRGAELLRSVIDFDREEQVVHYRQYFRVHIRHVWADFSINFILQSVLVKLYNPAMAAVRPIRPERPEPVSLHVQAMDNLRFIRNTMETAGAFTAVPGKGGMLMGSTAIFAAYAAHLSANPNAWLRVWLGEAVLALSIGFWFSWRKAARNSTPLLSKPFRRFVLAMAPSVFVGALLTFVMHQRGLTQLIPAMWLLLYGSAVTSSGAFSVRVVPMMGLSFLALGSFATLAPVTMADPLLALGFGGFHLVFGWVILKRYGG